MDMAPEYGITEYQVELAFAHMEQKHIEEEQWEEEHHMNANRAYTA